MSDTNHYAEAGVNLDSGHQAVQLMRDIVRSTYTPQVLSDVGSFGGLYSLSSIRTMTDPVLVASTDGVGTKTKVAARLNRWHTIGTDLVNHCVNDILVQGAQPLFFLDYVASDQLNPHQIADVVSGMVTACRANGCALLGGETAEMPGVYMPGEIDIVGTIVGIVDRSQIIDGSRIQVGDAILGLPSSGLHTNGYSLARKVLDDLDWEAPSEHLGTTIGDALLAVHNGYYHAVGLLHDAGVDIRGLAHITGGGIPDNLPRILREGTAAHIDTGTWISPPIFKLIQDKGDIPTEEMYRVFNMGLGMLIVIPEKHVSLAQSTLSDAWHVGMISVGDRQVEIR